MSFLVEGKKKEVEFSKFLKNPSFSTRQQDIFEHWDLQDAYGNKYDVKSIKKE